jgi:hypothetical protein
LPAFAAAVAMAIGDSGSDLGAPDRGKRYAAELVTRRAPQSG